VTLKDFEGLSYNWSVGNICHEIVGRTLAAAYYQHLKPLKVIVEIRLGLPDVARTKKLKSWCQEQSKKELFELQMDMCEWAVTELKQHPDELRGVSSEMVRAWTGAIEAERESLRVKKRAVPYGGFRGESQRPYTREMAEKNKKN
jgi:hypothetical protein